MQVRCRSGADFLTQRLEQKKRYQALLGARGGIVLEPYQAAYGQAEGSCTYQEGRNVFTGRLGPTRVGLILQPTSAKSRRLWPVGSGAARRAGGDGDDPAGLDLYDALRIINDPSFGTRLRQHAVAWLKRTGVRCTLEAVALIYEGFAA